MSNIDYSNINNIKYIILQDNPGGDRIGACLTLLISTVLVAVKNNYKIFF